MSTLLGHACAQLVLADPQDACSPLVGDYSGKVVVFTGKEDDCTLDMKGGNVQNSTALAGAWGAWNCVYCHEISLLDAIAEIQGW